MRLWLIVNPHAGRRAAAARAPELLRALTRAGVDYEVAETRGPGDATQLAHQARERGVDCLLVLGGDGTLNEVSRAYLADDGTPVAGPDLALAPCGTGCDFGRTFGVSTSVEDAVARLLGAPSRPIDLGILELFSHAGDPITRTFVNIASFGISGLTDRIVNRRSRWSSHRSAFVLATLRAMLSYRNAPVRLRVDGRVELEGPVLNVALANGRYFGGGMLIAPEAEPDDGLLDVVALVDLSRAQGIALAHKIYRGAHLGSPGVQLARGRQIEAAALTRTRPLLVDLDGETPGRLPICARIARGALSLRV